MGWKGMELKGMEWKENYQNRTEKKGMEMDRRGWEWPNWIRMEPNNNGREWHGREKNGMEEKGMA